MIEQTLVLLKPDAVQRAVVGEIFHRFERAGIKIVALKMVHTSKELALQHYDEDIEKRHGKEIREQLANYLVESPVIAVVFEGVDVIANVRKLVGDTFPNNAMPGTIRGDFSHVSKVYANNKKDAIRNLIHASANKEDAQREIKLWFKDNEIHDYKTVHEIHTM